MHVRGGSGSIIHLIYALPVPTSWIVAMVILVICLLASMVIAATKLW